jgi:hypothetical protein
MPFRRRVWEAVLCFLFLLLEHSQARAARAISAVIRSAKSPTNATQESGFVFLHLSSIEYERHIDEISGANLSAAHIRFQPLYCQWEEQWRPEPEAHTLYGRHTDYVQVWSNELIPSTGFIDPNFCNPTTVYPRSDTFYDVDTHGWVISRELFHFSGHGHTVIPDEDLRGRIATTVYGDAGFEYLGSGYFFLSGGDNVSSRIGAIREAYGDIAIDHVALTLFDNCVIGDVRVRYELFAPETMTVFAYNDKGVLKQAELDGYMVGAVAAGHVSAEHVLSGVLNEDFLYFWEQKVIVVLLAWAIWAHSGNPTDRLWLFALIGTMMLWLKSFLRQTQWFRPAYCGPISLAVWIAWFVRGPRLI